MSRDQRVTAADKATWRSPALGRRRTLELAGGARIDCFEAGSGPPIVFVHGLLVNANLWRKVVGRLSGQFRCVTLDLPLGSHTRPVPADLSTPGLAAIVAGAIEALGLEDVTLVGNDTGGAICQVVVTCHPERIGRLVLTSCDYRDQFPPAMFRYFKPAARIPGALKALFLPMRLRFPRYLPPAFGWLVKRRIDRDAEDSYVLPAGTLPGIDADLKRVVLGIDTRHTNAAADRLGTFHEPALIAWSSEDRFFEKHHAHRLARDLPDARLEWVEDARTFSMEDNPERVSELIADFASRPRVPARPDAILGGMATTWDCIVVGAGAAGLSAALVLGRARRRTLVVDAGGQSNREADGVGGLLGHDGRPPAALYASGRDELAGYPSVELRDGTVAGGELGEGGFVLELDDGSRAAARRVLLATGMDYRYPELPGVAERWGGSVFHCPFCHGWEHRDEALGVLDRGAAGAQRALLLSLWSDDVTLLSDGPAELGDEDAERLGAAGVAVDERRVSGLAGAAGTLASVVFADGDERPIGGLLVPATMHQRSPLAEQLGAAHAEPGPIVADAIQVDSAYRTSVPGLFAAGDVTGEMASVARAIAAGHAAAAMIVHELMAEATGAGSGAAQPARSAARSTS